MNIAADGPIPLAAASAFLCCSSHFALLQSGVCGGAAVANSAAPRRRHFRRQKTGSRISTLFVAVAVIRSAKKTQKPPTPLRSYWVYSTLHWETLQNIVACRVFTRKQQEKPLFLTAAESLCYYYIVLHTTT